MLKVAGCLKKPHRVIYVGYFVHTCVKYVYGSSAFLPQCCTGRSKEQHSAQAGPRFLPGVPSSSNHASLNRERENDFWLCLSPAVSVALRSPCWMEMVSSPPAWSLQTGFPAFLLVPPPTQTALTLQTYWSAIFYHSSFSKGFTRRRNSWLSSQPVSERNECWAFF